MLPRNNSLGGEFGSRGSAQNIGKNLEVNADARTMIFTLTPRSGQRFTVDAALIFAAASRAR
jgi:hypothetical protein